MNDKNNLWLWIGIGAVVVVGGYLIWQNGYKTQTPSPVSTEQQPTQIAQPTGTESAGQKDETPVKEGTGAMTGKEETMMTETVVAITSSGFSPAGVTIRAGGIVKWVNNDTSVNNVSSVVHPTHQVYPPLNLGNIQPGGSVSLKFPPAGTYKYHNHLKPTLTGSVTVR